MAWKTKHIISKQQTLLSALKVLNTLMPDPLVLFIVDENNQMVGTLTDGDSRRALVAGSSIEVPLESVMHKDFKFVELGKNDDVKSLQRYKHSGLTLLPVLNEKHNIVDIINFERYNTILPIDAVLMAGGKGVRLRPLTETTPKPLLPVGGKSIIDYNIDSLMKNGIKHISVTVNYLHEQ